MKIKKMTSLLPLHKKFDAVAFMRRVREEMSEEYVALPKEEFIRKIRQRAKWRGGAGKAR